MMIFCFMVRWNWAEWCWSYIRVNVRNCLEVEGEGVGMGEEERGYDWLSSIDS